MDVELKQEHNIVRSDGIDKKRRALDAGQTPNKFDKRIKTGDTGERQRRYRSRWDSKRKEFCEKVGYSVEEAIITKKKAIQRSRYEKKLRGYAPHG